jgi:hypothetical protein
MTAGAEKQLQFLQLTCLPLRLRIGSFTVSPAAEHGSVRQPKWGIWKMAILEKATMTFVTVAAQILIVATVLI